MVKLFTYEGTGVTIDPEALMLIPFSEIWKRDKNKYKSKAKQELAFVYFFCDPRSDYNYIIDEEERIKAIKEGEGMDENWKPDKRVKSAMDFYKSFRPSSAKLIDDTRLAIDKVSKFLAEVDLMALSDNGKPIYTVNTITSAIKQVPDLIKNLQEAEKLLYQEIKSSRIAGQASKTIFEDV